MSTQTFTTSVAVVFGDMDYARVLYFPRVFHYAHRVMEDWFAREFHLSYDRFLSEAQLGLPTVHAEADYAAPIRYGQALQCTFSVRRIGSSSIDLRFRFHAGAAELCEARTTVVCVAMDSFTKRPLPADLRAALARFLESGSVQP
jgi:4-hydroxybenzoyl-CoA thioesterase